MIEIPPLPKSQRWSGFELNRVRALRCLEKTEAPIELIVRIKQLPQDLCLAAATQERHCHG